ncbi:MAG: EAL domain-containing protein, partial [Gammaproteobacteria bacterium]|nr:EAL domain-containing protein [Gammaproteobacteria bacterium]
MNTSITKPTLLVADDEAEIGEIIEVVAEDLGFEVTCVTNGSKVVGLVEELSPTVVALDLRMPGADAVEIIRELGKKECDSSFLLMSGMDQRTLSAVKALGKENNLDIGATLTKPMSLDAIEEALLPYLRAQNNSVAAVETEPVAEQVKLGLNLLYEPEFQLKNVADVVSKQRMRVCAQWHKDDASVLAEEELNNWARDLGIAQGLSAMVLAESLEAVRIWSNQDFCPEISVSFDGSLLTQLDLPDNLAGMADSSFVPRELLAIEIKEAAITNRNEDVSDVLSRLRIKGFKISVLVERDGENILPMIDSIPIDQIVVDMSLLSGRVNFQNDMEIEFQYSSLTSLANNKGIATCAVNVDSEDQYQFMKKCNFNSARGAQILYPGAAPTILPLYTDGKFSEKL